MKAKEINSDLPKCSFLIERKYFHFDNFYLSACLLTFGYYNENGKFNYIYHLLIDDVFIRAFTDYFMALDHLRKVT